MPRKLWKGAISFGLVHAPVTLHTAVRGDEIDFDWLQRKTLQPVGYKRVVKATGKEVEREDIVKGVRQEDGSYVVVSDEEIRAAYVKATHTIDLLAFVEAEHLSFLFFETPYFVAPVKGGEKIYALLREALLSSKKIGIAQIVMHNKQHLAALIPTPGAIILNTLRWATEIQAPDDLALPPPGQKQNSIRSQEMDMAQQLIDSMTQEWKPEEYRDTFRDDILALVEKKRAAGQAHVIESITPSDEELPTSDDRDDLIELLKRSLKSPGEKETTETSAPRAKAKRRRSTSASRPPKSHSRSSHSKAVH